MFGVGDDDTAEDDTQDTQEHHGPHEHHGPEEHHGGSGPHPNRTHGHDTTVDWTPEDDTYVPPPGAVPDHEDDYSDTEYEPRPIYHMDEFAAHDPTPAPTHVPQNIKII